MRLHLRPAFLVAFLIVASFASASLADPSARVAGERELPCNSLCRSWMGLADGSEAPSADVAVREHPAKQDFVAPLRSKPWPAKSQPSKKAQGRSFAALRVPVPPTRPASRYRLTDPRLVQANKILPPHAPEAVGFQPSRTDRNLSEQAQPAAHIFSTSPVAVLPETAVVAPSVIDVAPHLDTLTTASVGVADEPALILPEPPPVPSIDADLRPFNRLMDPHDRPISTEAADPLVLITSEPPPSPPISTDGLPLAEAVASRHRPILPLPGMLTVEAPDNIAAVSPLPAAPALALATVQSEPKELLFGKTTAFIRDEADLLVKSLFYIVLAILGLLLFRTSRDPQKLREKMPRSELNKPDHRYEENTSSLQTPSSDSWLLRSSYMLGVQAVSQ